MNITAIEQDILKAALYQFSLLTGGKVKSLTREHPQADAEIEIRMGTEKRVFWIEVRHEMRQAVMPAILARIGKQKDHWLLISKYIPQPIKNQLKEQGVNYLEVAGNCYINTRGVFVYVNDRPVTPSRKTPAGKLWKTAGLKFLFAILSEPELLNTSYRTIAEAADIALGNIGPLLDELQAQHLKKTDGKDVLQNKEMLIQRWAELYQVTMKPGLQLGMFRFLKPSLQQEWKAIHSGAFLWGGEPAGELYTNFLEPELFTVYCNKDTTEVMKELHLAPDPEGKVQLIKQFWNKEFFIKGNNVVNVVPPLLAYADLMETNNSRNWEIAARIKNKYLND